MHHAIDTIFKERDTLAVCIHSDIRGFTQLVRHKKEQILKAVVPSQTSLTDIVNTYFGIPNKKGDLVFAFWENGNNLIKTIKDSLHCAVELIEHQKKLNFGLSEDNQIKRYVIFSFGRAKVGNFGGIDGAASFDIVGDCANLPSRIDDLSKNDNFKSLFNNDSIILSNEAARAIQLFFPDFNTFKIELEGYGLKGLRDFEEEKYIYFLNTKTIKKEVILNCDIRLEQLNKLLSLYY
jgi:class 3 adenylate cyclase